MCGTTRVPRFVGVAGCTCGCGCGSSVRHFFSSEEEKKCLETYRDELNKELKGVEECLSELKAE